MSKLALVTGATSGIGLAYSRLLASMGWDLIITGRRKSILQSNVKDIEDRYSVNVKGVIVDFSDENSYNYFLNNFVKKQKISFLVNNVGFSNHSNFFKSEHAINNIMINVHISAMAEIVHNVVPYMKLSGGGTIINVSSLAGFLPSLSDPFYSSSKVFISTYSESISMILKDYNISVQSLCPGFTRTDFHKNMNLKDDTFKDKGLKRWMSPVDVVDYSFKKISKGSVIIIPGFFNRVVYNLVRILPKRLYYKLASRKRALDEK